MQLKEIQLRALPFQVIEFAQGVILKRGSDQIVVTGKGALEKVLILLSATSGKSANLHEICQLLAIPDHEGMEHLVQELYDKKILIPADSISKYSSEDQLDVFLGQFGIMSKQVIVNLTALNIIIVGVNTLTHSIFSGLSKLGVENLSVYDDQQLRNHDYFDAEGVILEDVDQNLRKSILNETTFKKQLIENPTACMIATSDFGGQALLLKWNQFCVENKISLFPVYLQDMIGYAGPLIIPGETACLHCLRQRQNSNLQEVDLRNVIEKNATDGQSVAAIHPSVIGILAHTTVFELTHFFGELPFPRPGRLIRVDLMAGITQSQLVLKIPRCAVCSTLNTTADVQLKKMTPMPGI